MAVQSLRLALTVTVASVFCFTSQTTAIFGELPFDFIPPTLYSKYPVDTSFTGSSLLEPILAHLGFQQLSMAANGLAAFPGFAHWTGPTTLFAPSETAVASCSSCSLPHILSEHIVPGLFTASDLLELAAGTRIETLNPGHCVTVIPGVNGGENGTGIFITGVEINQPDLFNNGLLIVHGLDGYVSPLSPFSCPAAANAHPPPEQILPLPAMYAAAVNPRIVMDAMLRDAIVHLRNHGYGVLALALKLKYEQLVGLKNITIFAVEDSLVFSNLRNYAGGIRYHIVPDRFIAKAELANLPVGTMLETLESGQYLVVTSSGGLSKLQINNVSVKIPEVVKNLRVVIHSLFMPFPLLQMRLPPGNTAIGGSSDRSATPPETDYMAPAPAEPGTNQTAPAPAVRDTNQTAAQLAPAPATPAVPELNHTAPRAPAPTPADPKTNQLLPEAPPTQGPEYVSIEEQGACEDVPVTIEDSHGH